MVSLGIVRTSRLVRFDAAVGGEGGDGGMERSLGLRGRNALPGVDRARYEGGCRGLATGAMRSPKESRKRGFRTGCGVRRDCRSSQWRWKLKRTRQAERLVGLAPEWARRRALLVVELAEGHGSDYVVGGVQRVEHEVCRRSGPYR
jgi:hypothetical protein